MQRIVICATVCVSIYLNSVLGIIFFLFWVPIIWTFYIYVSMDLRTCSYFSKTKRVCEQNVWETPG